MISPRLKWPGRQWAWLLIFSIASFQVLSQINEEVRTQWADLDRFLSMQLREARERNFRSVYLLPVTLLGLANRLRIVASFHGIAKVEGSYLVVIWRPANDCDAQFHEIFGNSTFVFSLPRSQQSIEEIEFGISSSLRKVVLADGYSMEQLHPQDYLFPLAKHSAFVKLIWTRALHGSPQCHLHRKEISNFYKSLRKSLVPDLDAILSLNHRRLQEDSNSVVGVHIRAFDVRHDWSVVPPAPFHFDNGGADAQQQEMEVASNAPPCNALLTPMKRAQRFDLASPLSAFEEIMKAFLLLNSTLKFLVVSNAPGAIAILRQRFGNSIISTVDMEDDIRSDRSSVRGVRQAALDFFLLAETTSILHSRGSSFGREAGQIHGVPLIDVTLNENGDVIAVLSHESSSLISYGCSGITEYRRARGQKSSDRENPQGRFLCYHESEEGTPTNTSRIMCTTLTTICPCSVDQLEVSFGQSIFSQFPSSLPFYCLLFSDDSVSVNAEMTPLTIGPRCLNLPDDSNGHSLNLFTN